MMRLWDDVPPPLLLLSPSGCKNSLWHIIWDTQEIPGLCTPLFEYQRHTVARMLQMEMDPSEISDPLYVPLHTMDKRAIFLRIESLDVKLEQPTVPAIRGGLLCQGPGM